MFTVYTCCQPFRLLQSVPPNITIFRREMDSKWTVWKTAKNRPQAVATPSICPCSVLNCSRPNSDQYRLCPVSQIGCSWKPVRLNRRATVSESTLLSLTIRYHQEKLQGRLRHSAPAWKTLRCTGNWTSWQSRLTFYRFQYSRNPPIRRAFQGNCGFQLTLSSDEVAVVAWNGQSCGAYTRIAASSLSLAGAAT